MSFHALRTRTTLSGLMSPCTIPRSWRCATHRPSERATRRAASTDMRAWAMAEWRSSSPLSIARTNPYACPACLYGARST